MRTSTISTTILMLVVIMAATKMAKAKEQPLPTYVPQSLYYEWNSEQNDFFGKAPKSRFGISWLEHDLQKYCVPQKQNPSRSLGPQVHSDLSTPKVLFPTTFTTTTEPTDTTTLQQQRPYIAGTRASSDGRVLTSRICAMKKNLTQMHYARDQLYKRQVLDACACNGLSMIGADGYKTNGGFNPSSSGSGVVGDNTWFPTQYPVNSVNRYVPNGATSVITTFYLVTTPYSLLVLDLYGDYQFTINITMPVDEILHQKRGSDNTNSSWYYDGWFFSNSLAPIVFYGGGEDVVLTFQERVNEEGAVVAARIVKYGLKWSNKNTAHRNGNLTLVSEEGEIFWEMNPLPHPITHPLELKDFLHPMSDFSQTSQQQGTPVFVNFAFNFQPPASKVANITTLLISPTFGKSSSQSCSFPMADMVNSSTAIKDVQIVGPRVTEAGGFIITFRSVTKVNHSTSSSPQVASTPVVAHYADLVANCKNGAVISLLNNFSSALQVRDLTVISSGIHHHDGDVVANSAVATTTTTHPPAADVVDGFEADDRYDSSASFATSSATATTSAAGFQAWYLNQVKGFDSYVQYTYLYMCTSTTNQPQSKASFTNSRLKGTRCIQVSVSVSTRKPIPELSLNIIGSPVFLFDQIGTPSLATFVPYVAPGTTTDPIMEQQLMMGLNNSWVVLLGERSGSSSNRDPRFYGISVHPIRKENNNNNNDYVKNRIEENKNNNAVIRPNRLDDDEEFDFEDDEDNTVSANWTTVSFWREQLNESSSMLPNIKAVPMYDQIAIISNSPTTQYVVGNSSTSYTGSISTSDGGYVVCIDLKTGSYQTVRATVGGGLNTTGEDLTLIPWPGSDSGRYIMAFQAPEPSLMGFSDESQFGSSEKQDSITKTKILSFSQLNPSRYSPKTLQLSDGVGDLKDTTQFGSNVYTINHQTRKLTAIDLDEKIVRWSVYLDTYNESSGNISYVAMKVVHETKNYLWISYTGNYCFITVVHRANGTWVVSTSFDARDSQCRSVASYEEDAIYWIHNKGTGAGRLQQVYGVSSTVDLTFSEYFSSHKDHQTYSGGIFGLTLLHNKNTGTKRLVWQFSGRPNSTGIIYDGTPGPMASIDLTKGWSQQAIDGGSLTIGGINYPVSKPGANEVTHMYHFIFTVILEPEVVSSSGDGCIYGLNANRLVCFNPVTMSPAWVAYAAEGYFLVEGGIHIFNGYLYVLSVPGDPSGGIPTYSSKDAILSQYYPYYDSQDKVRQNLTSPGIATLAIDSPIKTLRVPNGLQQHQCASFYPGVGNGPWTIPVDRPAPQLQWSSSASPGFLVLLSKKSNYNVIDLKEMEIVFTYGNGGVSEFLWTVGTDTGLVWTLTTRVVAEEGYSQIILNTELEAISPAQRYYQNKEGNSGGDPAFYPPSSIPLGPTAPTFQKLITDPATLISNGYKHPHAAPINFASGKSFMTNPAPGLLAFYDVPASPISKDDLPYRYLVDISPRKGAVPPPPYGPNGPSNNPSSFKLSTAAIVAIVIAGLIVFYTILGCCYHLVCKKKKQGGGGGETIPMINNAAAGGSTGV